MPIKTVFVDNNDNEMECYLNDKGKAFISVGPRNDEGYYSGFITLDKQDVKDLIAILNQIEAEM